MGRHGAAQASCRQTPCLARILIHILGRPHTHGSQSPECRLVVFTQHWVTSGPSMAWVQVQVSHARAFAQFELILLRATHKAGSPNELPLLVLILWVPPSFWQPALKDPSQRAMPMSRAHLLGCVDTHLGCQCVELGLRGHRASRRCLRAPRLAVRVTGLHDLSPAQMCWGPELNFISVQNSARNPAYGHR